jgi:hypothetical protein
MLTDADRSLPIEAQMRAFHSVTQGIAAQVLQ